MNFSQRIGLEPAIRPFQNDSMDAALRNSLWNVFDRVILDELRARWLPGGPLIYSKNPPNAALFVGLWVYFYKWPLTTLPEYAVEAANFVHRWFFDATNTPWNKVYEFVEFAGNLGGNLEDVAGPFRALCNGVLEREFSAYRFVGKTIGPITNEAEIQAIEGAASLDNSTLAPVNKHVETALNLLADRNNPDYRNSMKESISAVEALCKIIAQNDKTTLGPALDALTAKTKLHPKLQEGFKALYKYTSDDHGIRHCLKDDAQPEPEDAKFMLVACSAFVNYLAEKARKNGLLPQ
jgi:AbiJ N-terminal domain 4